ncbi:iron-sulfur cluster assembly protein [Allopusillimonas ginsengisoli]|uniref:iron-sulfur cluster assembly protein n=1 Tax=Allopusillimonas ginsengisoli TaxID=453575 RepID=UPI00101FF670|nr:iron-sulfur cluster assembly protein [Allopusillimonas ginsengisoli]TEA77783.1 DUF59 domain-containing protein [Allopusillimonas ginsengisoli]
MVTQEELFSLIGSVRDPHLPFGLAELGMLERAAITDSHAIEIVVNIPCHHCPGLQVLQDDIEATLRAAGFSQDISVSFEGSGPWLPTDMSDRARAALRKAGIQINSDISDSEGAAT